MSLKKVISKISHCLKIIGHHLNHNCTLLLYNLLVLFNISEQLFLYVPTSFEQQKYIQNSPFTEKKINELKSHNNEEKVSYSKIIEKSCISNIPNQIEYIFGICRS